MEDFGEMSRMGLEGKELNLNCPRKYQNLLKSNILIANLSCIDASPRVEVSACAIPTYQWIIVKVEFGTLTNEDKTEMNIGVMTGMGILTREQVTMSAAELRYCHKAGSSCLLKKLTFNKTSSL